MRAKELDQWFTKPEVVELIMTSLNASGYDISHFKEVLDPCVGNKAFEAYLTHMMDIDPKYPDITKQDFLEYNVEYSTDRLILTNFPYGKSASLTIKMINHSATLCDDIITIAPMTMTRYSRQRRVNPELKLLWEMKLPKHSFLLDNESKDVPSIVQYWSRNGRCKRVDKPINTHPDFIISSRYNPKATFVIRGVRPIISNEIDIYDRISNNTRYYSVEPLVDDVEDKFRSIDLVSMCMNTGMPSLSIPECIEAYNNHTMDWKFDNKNPTHYIIGASRKVKPMSEFSSNWRGYKISSKLNTQELQRRFNAVDWIGQSSVSGGVFWLGKDEIQKQYLQSIS